jgi:thiol-disulfide isomerase/thioredoxin
MLRAVLLGGLLFVACLSLSLAPSVAKADEDDFAALIGKPAADFKAEFALNGKPVTLKDLKGKVVLLDFWAVWCGPCIRTFPHLIEWNKEFKDKGLEIVGVTMYNSEMGKKFAFDKEKGRLVSAESLTKDEEQKLLKDFADHHKLSYLLQPLSKDEWATVTKEYKIEGIPQLVVIDRKGIVRMVKVGSGDENAKAVEKMIKELLDAN